VGREGKGRGEGKGKDKSCIPANKNLGLHPACHALCNFRFVTV